MKKAVYTKNAPEAIGPYSQATITNNIMFFSGQLGIDPKTGDFVDGGIKSQTEMALKNLSEILASQGLSMDNVLKTTVYLKDMNDFAKMNEVYAKFFSEPYPARAAVEVARLPKDGLVEISAIAIAV